VLGEGEDALDVQLVDARIVDRHLGKRRVLGELIALPFVRWAVDGTPKDERLVELVLAPPQFCEAGVQPFPGFGGLGVPLTPDVEHDLAKERQVLRAGVSPTRYSMNSFSSVALATFTARHARARHR